MFVKEGVSEIGPQLGRGAEEGPEFGRRSVEKGLLSSTGVGERGAGGAVQWREAEGCAEEWEGSMSPGAQP
jgi:hypothetical protein